MTTRRMFKPDFKARVVLKDLTGVRSAAEVFREHQPMPQVLVPWNGESVQRAPDVLATGRSGRAHERFARAEHSFGRLTAAMKAQDGY